MKSAIICILCAVLVLLVSSINGGCLNDGDTAHVAADYNQRLYSYASKHPVQPSTSNSLKFFTFNLQSGYHANCVNNVTEQAMIIKGSDYVGNQEAVQNVDTRCSRCIIPSVIADVTGMSTRFVMAMPYRTGQYGTSLGTSQIILDTKYILMTISGYEPRVAVAVKTQPLALKGRYLWYVNIHVEFYSVGTRQAQIAQVVSFIQSQILASDSSAVIVMGGDFNGGPWDAMYTTLKNAGFKNSWEVFHGSINDGNTIPAEYPGSRFDHIWYHTPSDVYVTVQSAQVVNVLYSDHRPYTATLSFSVGSVVTPAPTIRPTTVPTASATTRPTPTPAPTPAHTPAPTPAPAPSSTCGASQAGFMKCAGGGNYQVCDHNTWLARSCQSGLVCKQNGNYIYCDHA